MSCSLLMGSGSAVLGAELAESDIFLEDVEAMDPSGESETEQELDLREVVDEIRTTEAAETLEITEIPEITEFPCGNRCTSVHRFGGKGSDTIVQNVDNTAADPGQSWERTALYDLSGKHG